MTDNKFLLALSDLHVGSAFGPWPRDFAGSNGATLYLNTGQEYLLSAWGHFIDHLPQTIDVLVINGDAVDGPNDKEEGRFVCETDPQFQAYAAHELLRPVVERVKETEHGRQVYMTRGSRYHVGTGGQAEEHLGLLLHARREPDGRHTHPWLHLSVNDVLFDVAHHQSYAIRNRGMPLEREISFFLERMARMRQVVPGRAVIVRSHVHGALRIYTEAGIAAVSTPCWKLQDEFAAMSKYPNRTFSERLGAVGFSIPVEGMVDLVPYEYEHPQPICEVIV